VVEKVVFILMVMEDLEDQEEVECFAQELVEQEILRQLVHHKEIQVVMHYKVVLVHLLVEEVEELLLRVVEDLVLTQVEEQDLQIVFQVVR
jgi:hypothetical protein